MQQVETGYAAGQRAIKIHVIGIKNIIGTGHGSDGQCALVNRVEHRV